MKISPLKIGALRIASLIPALALVALAALPTLASAEVAPAPAQAASPAPAGAEAPADARVAVVLEMTNAERVAAGMLPLRWNASLAAAAASHAGDMAQRGYFAHNSPEGTSPTERAAGAGYGAYGWGGHYVGENLARGYGSTEAAFRGWMESPGHRANILNPLYREMGAALAAGPGGTLVWAQEFGSRPGELGLFIDGDAAVARAEAVELSIGREAVSDWGSLGDPVRMMVSNSADFAGATWEPYAPRKGWRLEGEGSVGVYVLLEDGEGRSARAADRIVLTRPTLALAEGTGEGEHRGMAAAPAQALEGSEG